MKASIVLGLGAGDEGKGLTTSYLCSQTERPLVIRFNGGHQAGHTVVHNGHRHVFSSFGSGTLQGVPTYWSRFCTFNPIWFINEFNALQAFQPIIYVDPMCPVTTPFDRIHNIRTERSNQHGSCGVGFGATLARQEAYYKLHVQDLFFPSVLRAKLDNIISYYKNITRWEVTTPFNWKDLREQFLLAAERAAEIILPPSIRLDEKYDHLIFEGAQGILLDMDFGFFPNVTRSNTTSKNAHQLIEEIRTRMHVQPAEIYYVTRSYQTRHGNGFMTNEDIPPALINNENETNVTNEFQGKFRIGALDGDLLKYALTCDKNFSPLFTRKNLVVTCLDQTGDLFPVTFGARRDMMVSPSGLSQMLNTHFRSIITSRGPNSITDQILDEHLVLNK